MILIYLTLFVTTVCTVTVLIWKYANINWLQKTTYLLVLSLPFERIPSIEAGGASVKIGQILVLISVYIFFVCLVKNYKKITSLKLPSFAILPLSFFALSAFSWLKIEDFRRFAVVETATVLVFLGFILIALFLKDVRKTMRHLMYVMIGVCLFATYQFFGDVFGLPLALTGLREQYSSIVFGIPRIQATAIEPQYFAGMLFLPIFYSLYSIIYRKKWLKSKSTIVNLLVQISILAWLFLIFALTLSKGAWFSLAATILLIPFISYKTLSDYKTRIGEYYHKLANLILQNLKVVLSFLTLLVLLLTWQISAFLQLVLSGIQLISGYIGTTLDGTAASVVERGNFLSDAFLLLPSNILSGIGPGQYGVIVAFDLGRGQNDNGAGFLIVNNVFVEVLLERGLFAFLILMLFFTLPVYRTIRNKLANNKPSFESDTIFMTLIASLIQWIFFSPLYIMPVFIILALAYKLNFDYEK